MCSRVYIKAVLKQKSIRLIMAFLIKSVCIVALVTRREKRIFTTRRYIVRCGLSDSTVFLYFIL